MADYLRVQDGTAVEAWTAPEGLAPSDCFPPDLAETFYPAGNASVGWSWNGKKFSATAAAQPSVDQLRTLLVAAASAACDAVSGHIIPDATHQNAYTNAATIVWANGGNAPSADPAKSVFAAQGASVGIADPADFAKVVVAVSLGSMELATVLATLKGAAEKAQTTEDLAAGLIAFETSLHAFVTGLNSAGLTVSVSEPDNIIIPHIND
jgi:hypothetical protein